MARWFTFCPAKVNLYLAVLGRRPDGFHDLLSLVAPLDFGDDLHADFSRSGEDELTCTDGSLPVDGSNLVLKAAAAFRRRVRMAPRLAFHLDKRVPHGAGLGGGSSDAAGALRLLNEAAERPLDAAALQAVAAEVGSDCPLFLFNGPVFIRGRGERVEALPPAAAAALRGLELVIVKPQFGINTAWAYGELARKGAYRDAPQAEAELRAWIDACAASPNAPPPPPLFNSFQEPTFAKYTCYSAFNNLLRERGLQPLALSGSGSACFAIADEANGKVVVSAAEECFGTGSFAVQALAC